MRKNAIGDITLRGMRRKIKEDGSFPSLYWTCQIGEAIESYDVRTTDEAMEILSELLNHPNPDVASLAYCYLTEAIMIHDYDEKTVNSVDRFEKAYKNSAHLDIIIEVLAHRRGLHISV